MQPLSSTLISENKTQGFLPSGVSDQQEKGKSEPPVGAFIKHFWQGAQPFLSWRKLRAWTHWGCSEEGADCRVQPIQGCHRFFFNLLLLSSASSFCTQRCWFREQPHQGLFSDHPGAPGSLLSLLRCSHLCLSARNLPHLPIFTDAGLQSTFKPHLKCPSWSNCCGTAVQTQLVSMRT